MKEEAMASSTRALIASPLVVFIILCLSLMVGGYRGIMVGGRMEMRDVKSNEEVQELGRLSVKEFNRQQQHQHQHHHGPNHDGALGLGELIFSEVVEAQKQVVSGFKYYLKIEATAGSTGEAMLFDSVVMVKPWLRSMELLHFAPSTALRVGK